MDDRSAQRSTRPVDSELPLIEAAAQKGDVHAIKILQDKDPTALAEWRRTTIKTRQ